MTANNYWKNDKIRKLPIYNHQWVSDSRNADLLSAKTAKWKIIDEQDMHKIWKY